MRQDKRSSSSALHTTTVAVWSHLWNFALLYLVSRWNFFISSVTNGATNKSDQKTFVWKLALYSRTKNRPWNSRKRQKWYSEIHLNKMIFQTCFLLLGLQLTNAVLLSQEEDAKIQAAYPNLKTRPRIARRLREGKKKMLYLSYIGKNVPEDFFIFLLLRQKSEKFQDEQKKNNCEKICHNDILGKPQRPFYLIFAIFQSTRIFWNIAFCRRFTDFSFSNGFP